MAVKQTCYGCTEPAAPYVQNFLRTFPEIFVRSFYVSLSYLRTLTNYFFVSFSYDVLWIGFFFWRYS